jgi:predicted DNA-binding protein YlxM (UPF0122 family)
MFEKNMNVPYLLDFYGEVLNERHKSILDLYYNDDLSLAEIAESEGISRQGVRHIIKKGEEELFFLEEKLGLAEQFTELQKMAKKLSSLSDVLSDHDDNRVRELSAAATECVSIILSKK